MGNPELDGNLETRGGKTRCARFRKLLGTELFGPVTALCSTEARTRRTEDRTAVEHWYVRESFL
jgi:hypothetical protein